MGELNRIGAQVKRGPNAYNLRHGHASGGIQSPTLRSFAAMHTRCENPNSINWSDYGGRGITVCDRWCGENGFEAFLADMGERPDGKTLDRFPDSDGNYEQANCRWASAKDQQRHRRDNRMLTFNGETMPMVAWADKLGIKPSTIASRLANGWSIERAFTRPIRRQPHNGKRPELLVEWQGQKRSVSQLVQLLGVPKTTLRRRLAAGKSLEKRTRCQPTNR